MQFGLKDEEIKNIRAVLSLHPEVSEAIVFGSRAKGNYKPCSDIDIALKGDNLTLDTKWKIEDGIDDLLMPYKTDLVVFSMISNKDLIEHIERAGKLMYSKNQSVWEAA